MIPRKTAADNLFVVSFKLGSLCPLELVDFQEVLY